MLLLSFNGPQNSIGKQIDMRKVGGNMGLCFLKQGCPLISPKSKMSLSLLYQNSELYWDHYSPKGTIVCVEREKKWDFFSAFFLCWQVKMDGRNRSSNSPRWLAISNRKFWLWYKSITNFTPIKPFTVKKPGHWVMIGNRLPATTKGKNKPKDWLLAFLIKDLSRPEKCKLSNVCKVSKLFY